MNALRRLLTARCSGPLHASAQTGIVNQRQRLVDQIVLEMQATSASAGLDKLRDSVLRAMRTVPRHRFVPPELAAESYGNRPLPIGLGQTISQPFIVALMTELLDPHPDARVLEIGTGSGLSGGGARGVRRRRCTDRDRRAARRACARGAERARLQERGGTNRRRLQGLARGRALRRDHRDRGARSHSAAAGRTARAQGPHGDSRRFAPWRSRTSSSSPRTPRAARSPSARSRCGSCR